jgi:hypothetical protein
MGGPGPLGIPLASLCNRGAQICGSVPCSTHQPVPTMKGALVAARLGQRPKTNGGWKAYALKLGEHKANTNGPGTLRFLAIGDAVENETGWPVPVHFRRARSGSAM